MEEYLPLVDEAGNVVGKSTRSECHSGSYKLHPVVHLHVFNSKGELYLQKRSAFKKLLPLKWDTSVGGHVDYGETIMEALLRETREELGMTGMEVKPLFAYPFRSVSEYELVNAYYTVYDGVITPDKEEIEEGRFFSFKEINENLESGIFTPNFCMEFKRVERFMKKVFSAGLPQVVAGCMRIADKSIAEIEEYINFCVENGLPFFDHADIYGRGVCESKFGEALKNSGIGREKLFLQSKCSIVPGVMYDLSREYILKSVDGILERLGVDYLDSLLLHRPDALVEPEEVSEAFDILYTSGKVRHFGVSNHNTMQIELLRRYLNQPIEFNQLQLSLPVSSLISNGMEVNMMTEGAVDRNGGVLDYCRLNDITVQAWSPFQYGFFDGPFIGNYDKFKELNEELDKIAAKYGITPTGVATAWILRHPARIQMISGSTSLSRLQEMINGSKITLTREEWYSLYLKAGHILP